MMALPPWCYITPRIRAIGLSANTNPTPSPTFWVHPCPDPRFFDNFARQDYDSLVVLSPISF